MLGLVAFGGIAHAADVYEPAPSTWGGAYVGVIGGYNWSKGSFNGDGAFASSDSTIDMDGWMVGGQVGYDFMVGSNFVLGAVADISHADVDGDTCVAVNGCDRSEDTFAYGEMNWFGTVRAKAGITTGDALIYATGGLAIAEFKSRITNLHSDATPTLSDSHTHTGWVIGAGIDYKVIENVSLGVEYLYADFGSEKYDYDPAIVGAPASASGSVTSNIVRASINYHF